MSGPFKAGYSYSKGPGYYHKKPKEPDIPGQDPEVNNGRIIKAMKKPGQQHAAPGMIENPGEKYACG